MVKKVKGPATIRRSDHTAPARAARKDTLTRIDNQGKTAPLAPTLSTTPMFGAVAVAKAAKKVKKVP
jgi:hypothetical protein